MLIKLPTDKNSKTPIGRKLFYSGITEWSTGQMNQYHLKNNLNSVSFKTGIESPLSEAQRFFLRVGGSAE